MPMLLICQERATGFSLLPLQAGHTLPDAIVPLPEHFLHLPAGVLKEKRRGSGSWAPVEQRGQAFVILKKCSE